MTSKTFPAGTSGELPLPSGEIAKQITTLLGADFHHKWDIAKQLLRSAPPRELVPPLMELLQDDGLDWESRWFAARMLGEFDAPEVVTTLVAALLQLDPDDDDDDLGDIIVDSLTRIGVPAVAALVPLLSKPQQRAVAIAALARIRHRSTVEPLLQVAAEDPQPDLRVTALEALGSFHLPQVWAQVVAALEDPAPVVRREAIKILGWQQQPSNTEDPRLQVAALLKARLADTDLGVRRQAVLSLGRVGSPDAVALLAEMLQQPYLPDELSLAIIQALGWAPDMGAINALKLAWAEAPLRQKLGIVAALESQDTPELRAATAAALLDWSVALEANINPVVAPLRQSLALALGHLGATAATDHLQRLCQDPSDAVKFHAIAALQHLEQAPAN